MTFVADGVKGIVAVYTGTEDEAVEDNPLDHMDRVILHSGLPYVEAVNVVSGSTAMPAPVGTAYGLVSEVNLFAHGLPYVPLVIPHLTDIYDIYGTVWDRIPAAGSIPNWKENPNLYQNGVDVGLTSIFADGTHVKAITFFEPQFYVVKLNTITWRVYVTNVALEGAVVNPPTGTDRIVIDNDEITVDGKFSSHSTHFSEGGTGTKYFMPNGQTLTAEIYGNRTTAVTLDGTKFISSSKGTLIPGGGNVVGTIVAEAGGLTTVATTLRKNGS